MITIYSTKTCKYCKVAKDFFTEHGVEYTEKDVGIDLDARKEMVDISNQMGVPVIQIGTEILVGFDKDKLSKALGI